MGKPFNPKPVTDRKALENARELAEMAGPHLGEALATCLEVMRDPDSRQRLSAAGLITQWATSAPADETQSAQGNVRILVVQSNDLDELDKQLAAERIQRRLTPGGDE